MNITITNEQLENTLESIVKEANKVHGEGHLSLEKVASSFYIIPKGDFIGSYLRQFLALEDIYDIEVIVVNRYNKPCLLVYNIV